MKKFLACAFLLFLPFSAMAEEKEIQGDAWGMPSEEELSKLDAIAREQNEIVELTKNKEGLVTHVRRRNGHFADYTYDTSHKKIQSVATDEAHAEFLYNKDGDLIQAKNDTEDVVNISYDDKKQISFIEEENAATHTKEHLSFQYNDKGKPTKITLAGKGEITVEYDENGDVSAALSPQGPKMAVLVSGVFSRLLAIVNLCKINCDAVATSNPPKRRETWRSLPTCLRQRNRDVFYFSPYDRLEK